jgi:DNA-directed RNA polymerase specialized sigma subunit
MITSSEKNWIVMDAKEFHDFLMTSDGESRKKMFGMIAPVVKEDALIVIECDDPEKARELRREYRRTKYIYETNKYVELQLCSLYELINEQESISLGDTIPDPYCNVEKTVLLLMELGDLRDAIATLSQIEKDLVYHLYLSETPCKVKQYAKMIQVSRYVVHRRKTRVLNKLRLYLELGGKYEE